MKALVGAFNQEKALVGAFSVIVQPDVEPMDRYAALIFIKCVSLPRTTISMWIGCVLDVNMVMCAAVDCDGGCIVRS